MVTIKKDDDRKRGKPEPPLPHKLRDEPPEWSKRDFLRDLGRASRPVDEKPPRETE